MWRHAKLRRPTNTKRVRSTLVTVFRGRARHRNRCCVVSHTRTTSAGTRPLAHGTTVRSLARSTRTRPTRRTEKSSVACFRGPPVSLTRSPVIRTHHRSPAANSFRGRPHRTVQRDLHSVKSRPTRQFNAPGLH